MQTPMPPMPPMPPDFPGIMTGHDIVTIVVFSLMGAAVMVWLVARGPIGHAIGEVIKRWLGGSRQDVGQLDLNHRLDAMQRQLGELAERQDFAERLLAQARRDKALPGGSDVAG